MSWVLTLGDQITNGSALDDEFYADIVYAFQEQLSIQGVPLTFNAIEKSCLSHRLDKKLEWQAVGFLPITDVMVEMLDTDFAELSLAGIEEAQATVDFEGVTFQVNEVKKLSAFPLVALGLTKSK